MTQWNYDKIEKERKLAVKYQYRNSSRDDLLDRIIALEAMLYPLRIALTPILDKSWRGTTASSDLFPMRSEKEEESDKFYVYNNESHKSDLVSLTEEQLGDTSYFTEESLTIQDGSKLTDDFELLAFHQQSPGCYIGNGSISIGDVRRLDQLKLSSIYDDSGKLIESNE